MNSKSARQILLCRRPSGEDDSDPAMKRALAVAAKDRSLAAEFQKQSDFDRACADDLEAISLDEDSRAQIDEGARAFAAKHGGARTRIGKHAAFAVGVGFLLLVGLLVWMFLGRAGIFPDEAVKISMTGAKATPNQFDPVEEKADALQDWFMLKGFDNFRVPPEFAQFDVVGVRIFTVDNEPVAQVARARESHVFLLLFLTTPRDQRGAGRILAHHGIRPFGPRHPRGKRHVLSCCVPRFEKGHEELAGESRRAALALG